LMSAPYRIPFLLISVYCLHGPMMSIWQQHKAQKRRRAIQLRRTQKAKPNPTPPADSPSPNNASQDDSTPS